MAPARIAALLCCLAALLGAAAALEPAASAHERACSAAFGVLRRCAAAGATREGVASRCCGLLDIFQRNGCLCPDCGPAAALGVASEAGLLLAAQLAPLTSTCGTQPQQQPQQLGDEVTEPADAAQLRRSAGAAATISQAVSAANLGAAEELRAAAHADASAADDAVLPSEDDGAAAAEDEPYDEVEAMAEMAGRAAWAHDPRSAGQRPQGPLLDTPTYDYDNMLSDADTAFMLVDPAAAASYAAAASRLASRLAGELAADVAGGRRAAAALRTRLARLLAGGGAGEEAVAEGEEEEAASAGAVSDDAGGVAGGGGRRQRVRLAAPGAVPRTPEQRRATALAAALERRQEAHLARHGARGWAGQLLRGREQRGAPDEGRKRLSLDITIDADNPEAARRMADSIATLLRSWQAAAGSASSQAELAAALEGTAARLAAAAAGGGGLARAGLQPKQLLLQQVEEGQAHTCACLSPEASALDGPAPDLASAVRQRYLATRVALCRFACRHERGLAALLIAELALCAAWLAAWLLRRPLGDGSHADDAGAPLAGGQFLVATAADSRWHRAGEAAQPLLSRDSRSSSASSLC